MEIKAIDHFPDRINKLLFHKPSTLFRGECFFAHKGSDIAILLFSLFLSFGIKGSRCTKDDEEE